MSDIAEVYRCQNEAEALVLINMLRQHGIQARLVGEHLHGAIGELPPGRDTALQIWTQTSDQAAARELLLNYERNRKENPAQPQRPGWTCPRCDTEVEPPFDVCWNCLYDPSAC